MEHYDDFGRFVLGAEQLSVCRELLLSDSTPKQRMAVILLDSLTDALLYRIMERAFLYSDRAWFSHLLPLYPNKKREKARLHFSERLKIARDPSYSTVVAGHPTIITETDTTVLAIGHSYRNAAYHRDAHNPAVLATIGKVFFKSVGQLFVSDQLPGHGLYITREQGDRLRSVGIAPGDSHTTHEILHFHDAASDFTSALNKGIDVATRELALELTEDLVFRVQDAKENIDYLREVPGDIDEHLEWMEFWASHQTDQELMRLKDTRDIVARDIKRMSFEQVTSEMREKEAEAANSYNERFWDLWQTRKPSIGNTIVKSLGDIEKLAVRLPVKRSSASILQEYYRADKRLNTIEQLLGEAVAAYDERISEQIH
jgi:hypothetical protein